MVGAALQFTEEYGRLQSKADEQHYGVQVFLSSRIGRLSTRRGGVLVHWQEPCQSPANSQIFVWPTSVSGRDLPLKIPLQFSAPEGGLILELAAVSASDTQSDEIQLGSRILSSAVTYRPPY